MSFEAQDYGRSVAAPGLIEPDQPYSTISRCITANKESEGGFPIFAIKGEDDTAYPTKPAAVEQVKRVVEITPTIKQGETGAVGSKKVTVHIGTETFEITTTASDGVADVVDDLVAAINDASTGSALFVAADGTTKLTLTAKEYGSAANSIAITAESLDANIVIGDSAVVQTTAGVDGKEAGYFLGIAQRIVTRDEYMKGNAVTVVTTGVIWVKVAGDVKSGETVGVTADNGFVKYDSTPGTQTELNAKFITSAAEGGYAKVMLK